MPLILLALLAAGIGAPLLAIAKSIDWNWILVPGAIYLFMAIQVVQDVRPTFAWVVAPLVFLMAPDRNQRTRPELRATGQKEKDAIFSEW